MNPIADDIAGLAAMKVIEVALEQIKLHNEAANVYCFLEHQSTRAARHAYERGISARPHAPHPSVQ